MSRHWILLAALLFAPMLQAQPAPERDPNRLPPPVERVLEQLSLNDATRSQVRETLLRQRAEREQADRSLRERHRAELAALLTPDQLVALDAARPPPPGHRGEDGRRPPPPRAP
ncbi:MAG: hypothetical protein R3F18_04220 [Lysobacterales bacterium]|nr:hypothetical protein [Xanthomonadales bacterium]